MQLARPDPSFFDAGSLLDLLLDIAGVVHSIGCAADP